MATGVGCERAWPERRVVVGCARDDGVGGERAVGGEHVVGGERAAGAGECEVGRQRREVVVLASVCARIDEASVRSAQREREVGGGEREVGGERVLGLSAHRLRDKPRVVRWKMAPAGRMASAARTAR